MIRVAAATYLMIVVAAGPWVCCCTAARLTRNLLDSARREKPAAPSGCCGRHGASKEPARPPAVPHQRGCPCQKDPSRTFEAITPDSEVAHLLQQPHLASVALDFSLASGSAGFALPIPPVALASRGLSIWPFLTGSDLLRALHILRC